MSLSASCDSVLQKRTVSSLFAGRVVKESKQGNRQQMQEAALRLLEHHQNLENLLMEATNPKTCNISSFDKAVEGEVSSQGIPSAITGSLLVNELRHQAEQRGVALIVLTVTTLLQRLKEVTDTKEGNERRELLAASRRAQLCVLLESCRELLSQGVLCPKLLWDESTRDQKYPKLEVVFYLHSYNIITLKYILESDERVKTWLLSELKALCSWTSPHNDEATQVQHRVLTTVLQVLVGTAFELREESASPERRLSQLCSSVLDHMLFWLLETVEQDETGSAAGTGAQSWIELFDTSLCGALVSAEALQRCFTHCLTKTLTYKPRLTVSDAITLQNKWTFAKSNRLLTSFFCQLAVVFSVEQLLQHLQQVLATHEVNWQHVLCFVSTLLVYNPSVEASLTELLSSLLSAAFENYDLESVITAFLLARQGALEGSAIFPSYIDWFKKSFGGGCSYHAGSKKALVFLLKFLSDLVPFEPSQYLKVHILHPPYVPIKHRSLLMEYISLAKTRLADLKESVEDMGLYEDVSRGGPTTQPLCQVVLDVKKAVSLFESTGRISATVMEASIFRRPYFLSRFLPALLERRVLPVNADARMDLIEALKKADKIPAAQYAMYVDSCQRQRQQDQNAVSADASDSPVDVLRIQLQEFRELAVTGNQADMSAQLSRISHTLGIIFPAQSNELNTQTVILLHTDSPLSSELHVQVVNMILRNFCQGVLDVSRANPSNKQILWASRFAIELVGNRVLFSSLLHRLWDLFHNQVSSLTRVHLPGLAVFMMHLHASMSQIPLIQLDPPILPKPVSVTEVLSSALACHKHTNMLFCVRFCVAAVCYGMCRDDWIQDKQLHYIPSSVYKKLLYLIPRLLPEARRTPGDSPVDTFLENNVSVVWTHDTDINCAWRKTALSLWRQPAFQYLRHRPQYQLQFSEWLHYEFRVHRSEDALSEPERQEYQQWALMEFYLPLPEEQGGCGGNTRILCCCLINAIMDMQQGEPSIGEKHHRTPESFLPDILSRLQECVYEMSVAGIPHGCRDKTDVGHFLFELISKKVTSSVPSASPSISTEFHLQRTLHIWNRLLLVLPAVLFIQLTSEGGRHTLDCCLLIEHVNQHQRLVCCPAGLLPCHLTTHFLKGLLYASVCCAQPTEEVNKAWSQISLHCPLLLVSTMHWWEHVSVVVLSLWSHLCNGEPLPEQLRLLSDCHVWANRGLKGQITPIPPAPSLQLAACLYRASQDSGWANNSCISVLLRDQQNQEVMVFLLFLCVNRNLSSMLYPQENCQQTAETCTALLSELVDSSDWLSIFKSKEQGIYQPVAMVTSDEYTRLTPWAFYSLLCQQSTELLNRAACCPGFVHTAVVCYASLLRLFLDRHIPEPTSDYSGSQVDPSHILSQSKRLLLKSISQSSQTVLSSSHLQELQDHYADLDPEVIAALMLHQDLDILSPEMDFL